MRVLVGGWDGACHDDTRSRRVISSGVLSSGPRAVQSRLTVDDPTTSCFVQGTRSAGVEEQTGGNETSLLYPGSTCCASCFVILVFDFALISSSGRGGAMDTLLPTCLLQDASYDPAWKSAET